MSDFNEVINFDGVEATADKSFARPGTIAVFKITDIKFANSKNKNTPGMVVSFESEDSVFNETFHLKGGDADKTKKVLGRIQALLKYVHGEGHKLEGNITSAVLTAKLKGKELALKLTGQVGQNGKGYARLPFSGFGRPKNELNFLRFTAQEEKEIEAALEAIESSRASNSDSEGAAPSESATPIESENY